MKPSAAIASMQQLLEKPRIALGSLTPKEQVYQALADGDHPMSPHVGNFVQDLVEMAKAMDELPKVQECLKIEAETNEILLKKVQGLEENIIGYKREIETKNEAIRALEVAKDQAETMFLELDEKAGKVMALVNNVEDCTHEIKLMLDPPKPQPEPIKAEYVAEPVNVPITEGQSETTPTELSSLTSGGETTGLALGQSDLDPTSASTMDSQLASAPSTAESMFGAEVEVVNGPYFGKNYFDIPNYVSYKKWIEGSGTHADYWQRREDQVKYA